MYRISLNVPHLRAWSQVLVTIVMMGVQGYVETGPFISDLDQPVPMGSVQGVLGKKVALPCDIQSLAADDQVSMVLWFKDADGEPLYSYDVRGRTPSQPKLWSSPAVFGSRAYFRATSAPAALLVDPVMRGDAGLYRCRVDFRNAPTRNMKLNFTIITPPNRPNILDAKTRDVTKLLEPYNEGDTLHLICEVTGGDPPPRVVWYLENVVIDDSFEQRADGVTLNTLTFPNVGRQHLNARLVCQASNTNLAPPTNKVLIMDVNLRPLSVQILNKNQQLSADRSYEVECKATGSRPEAVITWWMGDKQIKKGVKNFSEANWTLSSLSLTVEAHDNARVLACRAHNPRLAAAPLQDTWLLDVHFIPIVTLRLGANLNPDHIKEFDDVYFECDVIANPKTHKLTWYKGESEIPGGTGAAGALVRDGAVLQSAQSLVLRGVRRAAAADYSCAAANSEGRGLSNALSLLVRFPPECANGPQTVQTARGARGTRGTRGTTVTCVVESSPPPDQFVWTYSGAGVILSLPPSSYNWSSYTSTLQYPGTAGTAGTAGPGPGLGAGGEVSCRARNALGLQVEPCRFRLVAAGPPMPPQNCTLVKPGHLELQVSCDEGYNGGLPQVFHLEIYELPYLTLHLNLSSIIPEFNVSTAGGLGPQGSLGTAGTAGTAGTRSLRLYASNDLGRSGVVELTTVAASPPDKYTGGASGLAMSRLAAWAGVLAALLAGGVCAVTCALYRRRAAAAAAAAAAAVAVCKPNPLHPEHSMESLAVKGENPYTLSPSLTYCGTEKEQTLVMDEEIEPDIIPGNYDKIQHSIDYVKLRKSLNDDEKQSNIYFDNSDCVYPISNRARGVSRVSRGVLVRDADITRCARAPEVVTSSRRVKESCI